MGFLPGWFSAAVRRGARLHEASKTPAKRTKARAAISRAVAETVEGRCLAWRAGAASLTHQHP